jgi:hypothetical protein
MEPLKQGQSTRSNEDQRAKAHVGNIAQLTDMLLTLS